MGEFMIGSQRLRDVQQLELVARSSEYGSKPSSGSIQLGAFIDLLNNY
jgi:hypothetical protein